MGSWFPDHVGTIDVRIDRSGNWFHDGRIIPRVGISKIFSTILRREGNDYFLVTPGEKLKIEVEDVPFIATDFEVNGIGPKQAVLFRTNMDDVVMVDDQHRLTVRANTPSNAPYLHVRDRLEARLSRESYYRLCNHLEEDDGSIFLWSGGVRHLEEKL